MSDDKKNNDTEIVNNFDLGEFNKSFDSYKKRREEVETPRNNEKLKQMNYIQYSKPLPRVNISKFTDTWKNIYYDVTHNDYEILKNDRSLYVGLTFIIVSVILLLLKI